MTKQSDWIKIISFENLYEAQIRKQLLENAGIDAVIVNARDSLFLVGTVDLYVKENDEKKALFLIEQFAGLTKINSFILSEPILLFKEYLESKGINTILKTRENEKYILENYELYVKNEDVEKVLPYLKGDSLDEWTDIAECVSVLQTRYRVELLAENGIKSFIIKKRDSDYHLERVKIYVKNEDAEKAREILEKLDGWIKIKEYDNREIAELREDQLGKNKIRAIIKQENGKFTLWVYDKDKIKATDIINAHTEWVEVANVESFINAESIVTALTDAGLDASILSLRDNMFMIGGYAVYVPKTQANEAVNIINELKNKRIEE